MFYFFYCNMAVQKPSTPRGTRDFGPKEAAGRKYIFSTIEEVFRIYGYAPVETPAMENLSTLLGKYGEEGDKLLFKILNSGDYLSGVQENEMSSPDPGKLALKIAEKGLRYDLTVPFARYIVQHRHEINFPFKRYQIQPVWRADRPQRGRYREFYQCDADVIGSNSLLNEVELIHIIKEVFSRLSIRISVKINNRKILAGIAGAIGCPDKMTDITVAIDKIDKTGLEKVIMELRNKGLSEDSLEKLKPVLEFAGNVNEKINFLRAMLKDSENGLKGLDEIETILRYFTSTDNSINIEPDLTLARGLDYYTGAIIEVKALDVEIGSICGGGRYDDLTGIFGMEDVSGVGISFGADRIYDVMEQLSLFPPDVSGGVKLMFINFGTVEADYCMKILRRLHEYRISAEIYPDPVKLKKQMAYANKKDVEYVALAGEEEIKEGMITLKDMKNGEQNRFPADELPDRLMKK